MTGASSYDAVWITFHIADAMAAEKALLRPATGLA